MNLSSDIIKNNTYILGEVSQGQRSENNLMDCRADQATQSKRRRQTRRRSQSAAGKLSGALKIYLGLGLGFCN